MDSMTSGNAAYEMTHAAPAAKAIRRAEPMRVRRGAQPGAGSQSAERDAGEDDTEHQRQGVRMALDEEEQEAKPHDLEGEKAEPGEEGCRQPS